MTFGKLTAENLNLVQEIGEKFTASVNYPGGFKYEAFSAVWTVLLSLGLGEIFFAHNGEKVVGLFGGVFNPDPFNGLMTAAEQFWYVLPEARGTKASLRLFDMFEEEAKARRCSRILMLRLEGEFADILSRLYERRDYKMAEQTFVKEI